MKAAIFIDVQKDFIDGALRNEKAIEVTPKIVEFAKTCVENGYNIYATLDTHKATEYPIDSATFEQIKDAPPTSGYMTTLEGQKLPVEHCIEGTDGWTIDNSLMEVLIGNTTFINKPTFGSFDLAEVISEDFENDKLDEIIICGFVSSICVLANAVILRAKFPNTKITVMKDLCVGVTDEDHNAAMKVLEMQQIEVC